VTDDDSDEPPPPPRTRKGRPIKNREVPHPETPYVRAVKIEVERRNREGTLFEGQKKPRKRVYKIRVAKEIESK
jgi:hypothetical protein